jgi:hypothetical protein
LKRNAIFKKKKSYFIGDIQVCSVNFSPAGDFFAGANDYSPLHAEIDLLD